MGDPDSGEFAVRLPFMPVRDAFGRAGNLSGSGPETCGELRQTAAEFRAKSRAGRSVDSFCGPGQGLRDLCIRTGGGAGISFGERLETEPAYGPAQRRRTAGGTDGPVPDATCERESRTSGIRRPASSWNGELFCRQRSDSLAHGNSDLCEGSIQERVSGEPIVCLCEESEMTLNPTRPAMQFLTRNERSSQSA